MSLPERKVKGKTSIKGAIFEVKYQKWVPKVRLIEKNLPYWDIIGYYAKLQ